MSNVEGWNRFAQSFFNKIDRIPYFDIRYSLFDIRYSLFQSFYSDQTGCPLAGGRARVKLHPQVCFKPKKSRLKTAPTICDSAI
jgi:hypothetical protein